MPAVTKGNMAIGRREGQAALAHLGALPAAQVPAVPLRPLVVRINSRDLLKEFTRSGRDPLCTCGRS